MVRSKCNRESLSVQVSHKKGRTTVKYPDKDIPRKTLDTIEKQSGLTL